MNLEQFYDQINSKELVNTTSSNSIISYFGKDKTMSSLQIAELTGKQHKHVIRDIKVMLCGLYDIKKDGPDLDYKLKQYVTIDYDNRDYTSAIHLNEELTLTLTSGYSVIQRNIIIKEWQAYRSALSIMSFRNQDRFLEVEFNKNNTEESEDPDLDNIKAKAVINKAVANIYDLEKSVKKDQMTEEMLFTRNKVRDEYKLLKGK